MITGVKIQGGYLVAALLIAPVLSAASVAPNFLPAGEIIVQRVFANQPLPKWENGFILARDGAENPAPQVYVFDRSGRPLRSHRVVLPDADRVILREAAISPKGTVAGAGTAVARDGRSAFFIAWLDSAGAIRQVARTSPFSAPRLCFTADETLWAAGREYLPDRNSKPEYDVLRRYGPDGRLVASLLPRSSFPESRWDPARDALLVSSGDRVALYSPVESVWVEISSVGEILSRVSGSCGVGEPGGLALTSSGSTYLSLRDKNSYTATPLCELDRQSQQWIRALVNGRPDQGGYIVGADGDEVIIYRGRGTLVRLRTD